MPQISILEDLYRHNRWATDKVLALCDGLTDEQLDRPLDLGFGSLRNTLFHMQFSEEIWLERWTGKPWRAFSYSAGGLPLAEIAARMARVEQDRQAYFERERVDGMSRTCDFQDSKQNPYSNRLSDLALHVANHGIHHRAQALHYLKQFDRKAAVGLDYLFYRLARPYVRQEAATVETMRRYGLEIASGESPAVEWNGPLIERYFEYNDWANQKLFELAAPLPTDAIERDFGMGMGSIRKTILHVFDAERFWVNNWTAGQINFDRLPETTTFAQVEAMWPATIARRSQFISEQNGESANELQAVSFGGPPIRIPRVESIIQVCGHGTHHRAQLLNMLRRSGVAVPNIDVIFWLRR